MTSDLSLPTHIWQFSASSQAHLQRCLQAVKQNNNNKWFQKFQNVVRNETIREKKYECKEIETSICLEKKDDTLIEQIVKICNLEQEEFCRELNADPITNFDYIVEKCLKDSTLYHLLASTLSNTSVVKICNHVFNSKDVNIVFTEHIYRLLLPTFLKKEHSMLSLDLLVNANESNPIQFKILLGILINDKDVPTNVLQEFVTTLNAKNKTKFLINLTNIDISNQGFVNNIFTINVAYKDCIKTKEINSYILTKLMHVVQNCSNDKNYGRLLLTYIKEQNEFTLDYSVINQLLECHRSPFQKPCINALNSLKKE